VQTIDQIFESESGGTCAGREFSSHLHKLTLSFGRILFQLFICDESSRALVGFEQATEFQFAIGAHYGVGIDGEIDGELAHGGELIASS